MKKIVKCCVKIVIEENQENKVGNGIIVCCNIPKEN